MKKAIYEKPTTKVFVMIKEYALLSSSPGDNTMDVGLGGESSDPG